MTRRTATALASALVLALALSSRADAKVVVDPVTHARFGVAPVPGSRGARVKPLASARANGAAPATCLADGGDCSALAYHGGPVQHGERDYLFFWTPAGHAVPAEYRTGLETWLDEVAAAAYTAGNPFSVSQQYYDLSGPGRSKSFVPYAVEHAGTIVDTDPYPASGCTDENGSGTVMPVCLTDAQLQSELASYVSSHAMPTGIGVEYFILTPAGVGSCFDGSSKECSYTSYCGYHSAAGAEADPLVYADLPWSYEVPGCDVRDLGAGYANADFIDAVVSVFSHELNETMTDPELDAWYQETGTDAGYENGDKCAYVYGPGGYGSMSGLESDGSGYWNVKLEANVYLLQLEFDNRLENCELEDTDVQPAVALSVSPEAPVAGSAASFTANVTDAAGVSGVSWSFGDGGSATGSSPSHTYAAAGEEAVTAIVTDNHGNESRATRRVTVKGPHAAFTATPSPAIAGTTIELNAEASSDDASSLESYRWDFGDGSAEAEGPEAVASHVYAHSGSYTVKLTAKDALGLAATHEQGITVWAPQTVTAVKPAEGPEAGGTSVLVEGTGFAEATGVRFGAAQASAFEHISSTQVRVSAPPGAGVVNVVVESARGDSAPAEAARFTYLTRSEVGGSEAGGTGTGGTGSGGIGGDGGAGGGSTAGVGPGSSIAGSAVTSSLPGGLSEGASGARPAAAPSSAFRLVGRPRVNRRTGAIAFTVAVSAPGTLSWALTFRNGSLGVTASASRRARAARARCRKGRVRLVGRCRPARVVFARGRQVVTRAGTVTVTVRPGRAARRALEAARRRGRALPVAAALGYSARGANAPTVRSVRVLDGLAAQART